ncbi:MAG: hypothetical protein CM1200mP39_22010 [Dehalococcoidia bacterium]|nr:MAG: hypothetical protein CM1200mP39_22010 [Dehalococcoidia bacterium]
MLKVASLTTSFGTPFAIGANHQSGPNIIFEPLAFFSAFDSKTIPWLAESWDWNGDYTELTMNLGLELTGLMVKSSTQTTLFSR